MIDPDHSRPTATDQPQLHAAGFVLVRREASDNARLQMLMLENARHRSWGVPKGHIEPGESVLQGAWRELQEETTLTPHDVRLIDGFEQHIQYYVQRSGRPVLKRVTLFLAEALPGAPARVHLSHEHSAQQWCDVESACALIADWDDLQALLREAATAAAAALDAGD